MPNESEEKPVQMKLVESPEPPLSNIQIATRKKRQRQLSEERDRSEVYRLAVQDAVTQLDRKILNQLEATMAELDITRQALKEDRQALTTAIQDQTHKNDALIEQNQRYQSTLEKLLPSITEMVINNKAPHVAYAQGDWGNPDVVITRGNVPSEIVYAYTAGILGQFVSIGATRMGGILRQFDIYGDPAFHCEFQTGGRSVCHKYKLTALKEIFLRKADRKYIGILKIGELERIHQFLKMKAQENGL